MADLQQALVVPQPGRLVSVRLRPGDTACLERLAPGLSQLGVCRQFQMAWDATNLLWMRLGPDEWWCWWPQAEPAQAPTLMQAVSQASDGIHSSCVDLSAGQSSLMLSTSARQLLSLGCDLDFERLPGDLATRTRLGSFSVVIAPSQGQAMSLWVETSLCLSLQQWLERAARQLGEG